VGGGGKKKRKNAKCEMQTRGIFYGRLQLKLKKGCFTNDDDVSDMCYYSDQVKMDGMGSTYSRYEDLSSTLKKKL
jgi:hypothetical protein